MSIETSPQAELAHALENQFKIERAVLVSRAALGLSTVLECWRERRGVSRVALPGAICHEVVVAVLAARCEPVFCDVDPADGLVTEDEWSKARSRGADAAIVVHLYGNPADAGTARKIFPAPDCLLIDDAAQALGSSGSIHMAGAGGDVGLLSFGPTKHIATGNAALLFRNAGLAEQCIARLRTKTPQPHSVRAALAAAFRTRLETARASLRAPSGESADGFHHLLEGLEPLLAVPYSPGADARTLAALSSYADAMQIRAAKKALWASGLAGTALRPVGMASGCVAWRYACRSPGLGWLEQHQISEALRAAGMHVSNWYLPAHWLLGKSSGSLPGVEQLAREVFQFWLDEATTPESIAQHSATVNQLMPTS